MVRTGIRYETTPLSVKSIIPYVNLELKKETTNMFLYYAPPPNFEEEGVYCFANVCRSVGLLFGRPNGFL